MFELVTNDMMTKSSRYGVLKTNSILKSDQILTSYQIVYKWLFCLTVYRILDMLHIPQQEEDLDSFPYFYRDIEPQLFESATDSSIHFPLPDTDPLNEQVIIFS